MFFFAKMEGGVLPSFSNEVIYFNVLGVDKIIRCLLHILLPKNPLWSGVKAVFAQF